MSSQRHFLYLLPRADPDELNDIDQLPPCTCSHRVNSPPPSPPPPLKLRIRIPPKPAVSNHNPSSSVASTSTSTTTTTSGKSSSSRVPSRRASHDIQQSHRHPPISSDVDATRATTTATRENKSQSSSSTATSSSSGQRTPTTTTTITTPAKSHHGTRTAVTPTPSPPSSTNHPATSHTRNPSPSQSAPLSSSSSSASNLNTRNFKHQFTSWKLMAPQVTTISAITNTYLLLESFAGSASGLPFSLTPASTTTIPSANPKPDSHNNKGNDLLAKINTLSIDDEQTRRTYPLQVRVPLPSPSPIPTENVDFDSLCLSDSPVRPSPPPPGFTSILPASTTTSTTLTTIQESGHSDDGRSSERSGVPSLSHTTTSTNTNTTSSLTRRESSSGSSGSRSASIETCSTPDTALGPEDLPAEYQPCQRHDKAQAGSLNEPPNSPTSIHGHRTSPPTTISSPIGASSLSRATSASTSTSASMPISISTSRRRIPTAYRKEMESVLFAQTAMIGGTSVQPPPPSAQSRRTSSSDSTAASAEYTTPTLTSAIFSSTSSAENDIWSTNTDTALTADNMKLSYSRSSSSTTGTTTSPTSSIGRSSISSIPFLLDAPNLVDTRRLSRESLLNDPFYMACGNCNVLHVNDLGWYLEKVLWKLGMHRKGRKEFMSYWLPRFSNDDYVALRFLAQDEIAAFAPIQVTVLSEEEGVSTSLLPAMLPSAPSATLKSPRDPGESVSTSKEAVAPVSVPRRESEQSVLSVSSDNELGDDHNTSSSLSARSSSITSTSTASSYSPMPETPTSITGESSIQEKRHSRSIEQEDASKQKQNPLYSFHRIHVLFQRLKSDEIHFFQHRVRYRSGSSTEGVIDWSEIDGIKPTDEARREDIPKLLHVSATDLGHRGHYFH